MDLGRKYLSDVQDPIFAVYGVFAVSLFDIECGGSVKQFVRVPNI